MLYIPDITLHTTLHLPELLRLTAKARHLRPTRYTGFYKMTNHKLVYQIGIFLRMLQHVWTGTYNRHITLQHIDELWQFIYTSLPHNLSDTCFTRIVCRGLESITLRINLHRTELVTPEFTTILTTAFLLEKDRTGRT